MRESWAMVLYLDIGQILYFFRIFLLFFKIVKKSLDLVIMSHSKEAIF
jgi:hypothetical protein